MKWGIMATGNIAGKFAETINKMDDGQSLAACASRDAKKAKEFADKFGIKKSYGSYEEMLSDNEVEIVYIATPNNMHYENCLMCLNAGKNVLCEKPFTTNRDDAEKLYCLAKDRGLFIMEAFWIRHLPIYKKLREIIKNGEIGDIVWARSDYGFVAKGDRKKRKFSSDLGGGALLDIGIYNLGFMRMVMGDDNPVSFTSQYHINEYGTDDFSSILLNYPDGRYACVSAAIGVNIERKAAIYGTEGSIMLDDFQKAEKLTVHKDDGEDYTVEMPFDINGFEYQIREAQRCIEAKMSTSDELKKEDTLDILGLMDDIRREWGMKFTFEKTFQ